MGSGHRRTAVAALTGVVALAAAAAWAQTPQIPATVPGYVVTFEVSALAPGMKAPVKGAPEAEALIGRMRSQTQVSSRAYLHKDLSRQEILSTDFVLPAGTLVLHRAGDKFYVIADPKAKTYLVMDSEGLLNALEGGAGIVNSQYDAKVTQTAEQKTIAGLVCRKSMVTVTYVSAIPFENDRVFVQQKNDIEVWHTKYLVSSSAMDHFFFKFQRDKTGGVQKILGVELGFPMEMHLVVTQGAPGAKKAPTVQPGSFHMAVTDVKQEPKLDSELFRIPPAGFRQIEKNPYFRDGAQSNAAPTGAAAKP